MSQRITRPLRFGRPFPGPDSIVLLQPSQSLVRIYTSEVTLFLQDQLRSTVSQDGTALTRGLRWASAYRVLALTSAPSRRSPWRAVRSMRAAAFRGSVELR